MPKISDINLASSLLEVFILIGFIATALVFIRFTIMGINYINANHSKNKEKATKENDIKSKGF